MEWNVLHHNHVCRCVAPKVRSSKYTSSLQYLLYSGVCARLMYKASTSCCPVGCRYTGWLTNRGQFFLCVLLHVGWWWFHCNYYLSRHTFMIYTVSYLCAPRRYPVEYHIIIVMLDDIFSSSSTLICWSWSRVTVHIYVTRSILLYTLYYSSTSHLLWLTSRIITEDCQRQPGHSLLQSKPKPRASQTRRHTHTHTRTHHARARVLAFWVVVSMIQQQQYKQQRLLLAGSWSPSIEKYPIVLSFSFLAIVHIYSCILYTIHFVRVLRNNTSYSVVQHKSKYWYLLY